MSIVPSPKVGIVWYHIFIVNICKSIFLKINAIYYLKIFSLPINGSFKDYSVYELVEKKMNNYNGWDCSIGVDLITIQHELIYRGVCRVGGIIGNINDEDFGFVNTGVICKAKWCTCLMDLQEPRFKP